MMQLIEGFPSRVLHLFRCRWDMLVGADSRSPAHLWWHRGLMFTAVSCAVARDGGMSCWIQAQTEEAKEAMHWPSHSGHSRRAR